MGKTIQLKDKDNNELYPITLFNNVRDENGNSFQSFLENKANKADIPTKTSQLNNDSGFLTQHQDISGKADKIAIVEQTNTTLEIQPNVFNKWGEVAELNITFANPTENNKYNRYILEFISGATATNLTLPNNIVWGDGCGEINVETNKVYELNLRYANVGGVTKLLGLWEGFNK